MPNDFYNEEAERAILGSIILEPERVMPLAQESGVTESTFVNSVHASVFRLMQVLWRTQKGIDIVTLGDAMKRKYPDNPTASMDVDRMVDGTPTAAHAEYYIKIAKELEERRTLMRISDEAKAEVRDDTRTTTDIAANAVSKLLKVAEKTGQSTPEELHALHIAKRTAAKAGGVSGTPSRWTGADSLGYLLNSYNAPDNIIVAAKPSTGKTVFLLNEFRLFAEHGIPVGIFSLDMTEYGLRQRMAAELADVNAFKFGKGYWTDEEAAKMDVAWTHINSLPIYIDDNSNATIHDIISRMTSWIAKYGIKFFAIDFLQQISKTKEEYRYDHRLVIGEWSKRIKSAGKRFGIPTMVLSQLARYGEKGSDVTPPHPTLETIKETGDIENNADLVIFLAREPGQSTQLFTYKHKVWNIDFIVAKQRDGPTGIVNMCLIPARSRFVSRKEGECLRLELGMQGESA